MVVRIQKWGNSLALRIPRAFAAEARMELDAEVDLALVDGKLVISTIKGPSWTLEDLLKDVTPEQLHGEIDCGPSVGAEAW